VNRLAGVLVLAALSACEDTARDRDELFAPLVPVAAKDWDGLLLEFGSPRALPQLSEEGWSHGETAEDGNTFRWAVSERASFTLSADATGKRMLWLECEPFLYEGAPTQWIAITLNGDELTEIELRPGRERYPVEVPLVSGDNVFELFFRYAGDPNRRSSDRRELAVAFFQAAVMPSGEPPVAGAPSPFSFRDGYLMLPAGGAVTVYPEIAGEATLSVSTSEASSGARISVTASSSEETLLGELFSHPTPFEQVIEHDGPIALRIGAEDHAAAVRVTLSTPAREAPTEATTPVDANIVLIFLDGANALRTGLYGYERETTPVIDALGADSLVYDAAVSQAVYTIASMGSVLTGQYPERHQSVTFADRLRDDVLTLPGVLSQHGYRTAGFSGNSVASETFGLDQGYQDFVPVWENDAYTGHGDSVFTAFRDWLAEDEEGRFFAYVHFREPHFPYNPPAPFDSRFGPTEPFPEGVSDMTTVDALNAGGADAKTLQRVRDLYDGNLAYVDSLVGELLRCLDERGLTEETIVVVTADHGEALFEHGFIGHNTQLYEESIRIPLVLKIPGRAPGRVTEPVELLDLTRTLVQLAGASVPDEMQGRSLFAPREDRVAFTRSVWKRARYSARTKRSKLIWDSRTGKTELYDLVSDPREERDIHDETSFLAGRLEHELYGWLRRQEHARAGAPAAARFSEEDRRGFDALGYFDFVDAKRKP